ncbi:MAG: 3'(2'),5'-bisphosphate nucleotidase CysQ [Proteobacteria bacterium]|nr:MAG: 3'(2'),5'-bisphosphate nucleotidase CysQ [Pseudomonadota bacterium]
MRHEETRVIEQLEALALEAGAAILDVYKKNAYQVQTKADQSPVTEADLLSNQIILAGLKRLGDLPYISEEEAPKAYAKAPDRYWLIDPLDGTKEFIARRNSFTVNIALIENKAPVLAVVYDPVTGDLYSASYGSYRENGKVVKDQSWAPGKILVSSHSHPEAGLDAFIKRNPTTENRRVGSSIKFCLVASGKAHLYPRFGPLKVWDTAAGDGVARAAGCRLIDWKTGLPPEYEYDKAWTPAFCLSAPHISVDF